MLLISFVDHKAMCPPPNLLRRALWPGWYPQPEGSPSIALSASSGVQEFSILCSCLGRRGAAERRAKASVAFAKVSQALRVGTEFPPPQGTLGSRVMGWWGGVSARWWTNVDVMTTWRSVERFSLISGLQTLLPATNRGHHVWGSRSVAGLVRKSTHVAQSQKAPVLQLLGWRWVVSWSKSTGTSGCFKMVGERVQVPRFHLHNTAKAMKVWTGPRPAKWAV